jgi:tRNA G18 (ribose-2'-O)-methylase SpoU
VARIVEGPGLPGELRAYHDLRDVQLRQAFEIEHGLYLAEGEKVIRRALAAGHKPFSFLLTARWLESLADVLAASDAPCHVLSEAEIEQLTGFHVHRGALAAMQRPEPVTPAAALAQARRVVVMEDLADHANVGAVFRSVAAFGWDAVLLSPRCADPYYRRSIKTSMGAVFSLPFARIEDWHGAPGFLRQAGFATYAMTLAPDSVPIDSVRAPERLALVVGSEGHGLSHRWESGSDVRVTIPMAAGIDSLNVAASVAVACFHLR